MKLILQGQYKTLSSTEDYYYNIDTENVQGLLKSQSVPDTIFELIHNNRCDRISEEHYNKLLEILQQYHSQTKIEDLP